MIGILAKLRVIASVCVLGVVVMGPVSVSAEKADYIRPKVVEPLNNQTTPARAELGKALFFDPRLSGSRWISCATCHNPALGWSDGLATGIGHGMESLARSTPTVLNVAYNKFQFWDGRARSLEEQALRPIEAEGEMHRNIDELLAELQSVQGYRLLFQAAYPDEAINRETLAKGLAAYQRTLLTPDAPFDRWVTGDANALTESEQRGFEIFEGKGRCSICHEGFNFQDDGFHNIGLKQTTVDLGRYEIRPVLISKGAFKTPTLREITRTAPYMHDGSYKTLMAVIDHYDRGGDTFENLSPNMVPLGLMPTEKQDLLAFLGSLVSAEPLTVTIPNLPQSQEENL